MIPHAEDSKQRDDTDSFDYDTKAKKVEWHHRILLNRPLKVLIVAICLGIIGPMLFYHYLYFPSLDIPPSDGYSIGSCLVPRTSRLFCGPGKEGSTECHPECCYDFDSHVCFHRFPSRFTYILDEQTWTENATLRSRIDMTPFSSQESIRNIKLSIDEVSPTHVTVIFYDPQHSRFEGQRIPEKNYSYEVSTPELNVVITNTLGNEMFNTIRGPIIGAENIWEIAFKLTEESMFGLGEIPLEDGTTKVLYNHAEGFTQIPLIFAKQNNTFHGLLIDIIEPTEVSVKGDNQIVVRSITKMGLKFHVFSGPKPQDIMEDVRGLMGSKTKLEYWMLGAHICSTEATSDAHELLSAFITEASSEKLPYDSHCGIPVIFDNNRCEDIGSYIEGAANLIRNHNKKFVPHISPHIFNKEPNTTSDDNSTEIVETKNNHNCSRFLPEFENLMLRSHDSKELYKGEIANNSIIYPDYKYADITFMKALWNRTDIDGAILEKTWPFDDSTKYCNETYGLLPYFNENFARAFNHTPQWNTTWPTGEIYIYTHNQYGNHFAEAFRIVSDVPLWVTSPRMSGEIVNIQNTDASWTNMHKQLIETALGGISGRWLLSTPICGDTEHFNMTTQSSLCVKWYMAGSYLPLIKIHSETTRRDPLAFSGTNKMYIITALHRRLSLLPYFFTTLQTGPLLRPMFYQFPFSEAIINVKTQFSVGDDLLIVPNLQPSQTHVHVNMPPGNWFEFWSGLRLQAEEGEVVTMTTTEADLLTLVRGGSIIVMQKDVEETAEKTQLNSEFSLTIALHCQPINTSENNIDAENLVNYTCDAKGSLYLSENISLIFESNAENLAISAIGEDFKPMCDTSEAIWSNKIKELNIFGLLENLNNYDYHKHVVTSIDLCELKTQENIVFNFGS